MQMHPPENNPAGAHAFCFQLANSKRLKHYLGETSGHWSRFLLSRHPDLSSFLLYFNMNFNENFFSKHT